MRELVMRRSGRGRLKGPAVEALRDGGHLGAGCCCRPNLNELLTARPGPALVRAAGSCGPVCAGWHVLEQGGGKATYRCCWQRRHGWAQRALHARGRRLGWQAKGRQVPLVQRKHLVVGGHPVVSQHQHRLLLQLHQQCLQHVPANRTADMSLPPPPPLRLPWQVDGSTGQSVWAAERRRLGRAPARQVGRQLRHERPPAVVRTALHLIAALQQRRLRRRLRHRSCRLGAFLGALHAAAQPSLSGSSIAKHMAAQEGRRSAAASAQERVWS